MITDVYKVVLTDIETHGFLFLKCHESTSKTFLEGDCYLIDKIQLIINPKAEIILSSTTLTVLLNESDESYEVESLHLSQKQDDLLINQQSNELLAKESREAFQEMIKIPYVTLAPDSDEPPLYTSIKQIKTESERILLEWSDHPDIV